VGHALDTLSRHFLARPTGIIHVGASTGQEIGAYRSVGIQPVLAIEPLDAPYAALVKEIGDAAGVYPVKACLSDRAGRHVEFHVASNDGMSSSYLVPTGHVNLAPEVTFAPSTVAMVTTTLDHVVQSAAVAHGFDPQRLDYLAIDTQGSELDILRGSEVTLARVNFIFTEVSFGTLYEGSPSQYDIVDHLRARGFDLYDLRMDPIGWGDALFVRTAWMDSQRNRIVETRNRAVERILERRNRPLRRLKRFIRHVATGRRGQR
jgi:FkbM family methyltransferase